MNLEIEATFVEVDKAQLRKKLKNIGAELIQPETLMRRVVFSVGPTSFARVRDEGKRIVLTYKNHFSNGLTGTEEINVEVDNYENTIALLKACGLKVKSQEDSYRESWKVHDVEIDIDTWPWIPSYVEIEGPTTDDVESTATLLGFDMKNAIIGSVDEVYKLYYDVTNEIINFKLPVIKFTDAPDIITKALRQEPLAPATQTANPKISK